MWAYIQTDHEAVYCSLNFEKPKLVNKVIECRNLKKAYTEQFQAALQGIDWHNLYVSCDIDIKVHIFNESLLYLFDAYCPLKRVELRKPKPPWLTYNLKKMIELKHKAFSKFKALKSLESKQYYLQLKNYVTRAVKAEKKAYFSIELGKCKGTNKSKQIWDKMSKLNITPNENKYNLNDFKDPDEMNDYFLDNVPQTRVEPEVLDYFLGSTAEWEPFHFTLVTEDDILACIKSIKSNAVGADQISVGMLRACLPHCLKPLLNIVNFSLQSGTVPAVWKMSVVTPLPKVNNPSGIDELRPVSILPAASKVLEKVVKCQVVSFLAVTGILPKFQSGFRRR